MAVRNRHRVGAYLMTDDQSGQTFYADDMRKQWDGLWVHKDHYEPRNPQEFVKAKGDPYALKEVRPATYDQNIINGGAIPLFVGSTTVPTSMTGPAAHLYDLAIPDMVVGTSFVVR